MCRVGSHWSGRYRSFLLGLVWLSLPIGDLIAAPTTAEQAQTAVIKWLEADPTPVGAQLGLLVAQATTYPDENGDPVYYVVSLNPTGFVIVPADDGVEPIIAFAAEGTYDPSEQNPLGALVTADVIGRIKAIREVPNGDEAVEGRIAASQEKWTRLLSGEGLDQGIGSVSDVRVDPFVQSLWSQSTECGNYCYNYYTPSHYVCGCVATAQAQLMRFHQYPTSGIGVWAYSITVGGVSQTAYTRGGDGVGGPYNWGLMSLDPGCGTTDAQRQAIGALCYDAGVTVNMSYSSGSSGANTLDVATSLRTRFGYSNAKKGYNSGSNIGVGLNGMINPNLDAGWPVVLGITGTGGHAIVADGYGYNLSTLYHHLNMGWAGSSNAWYNLPNIDVSPPYTSVYKCVYNVYTSGSGEIISGRVTDEFGNPIAGAVVSAGGYTDTTDSHGVYGLAKVPSGWSTTVSVTKSGYTFTSQSVVTGTSTDNASQAGNVWGLNFTAGEPNLFTWDSPTYSGLYYGRNFDANCPSPPRAAGNVTLTFWAIGDLDLSTEYVTVYLNGHLVGTVFTSGAQQCPTTPNVGSLTVSASNFNTWVPAGTDAVIRMVPSSAVTNGTCSTSWIRVRVQYAASAPPCTPPPTPANPTPTDGAVDVLVDTVLGWNTPPATVVPTGVPVVDPEEAAPSPGAGMSNGKQGEAIPQVGASGAIELLERSNATGELIGIDFDAGSGSPTNWNVTMGGASSIVMTNLKREDGTTTGVGLTLVSAGGSFTNYVTSPNPSTVPIHSPALGAVGDYFYCSTHGLWTFTFRNLVPGMAYNVYVFGLRGFEMNNSVTIQGGLPSINFTQSDVTAGNLWVNREVGVSGRTLESFAEVMTATSSGEIVILVNYITDSQTIAGLAVEPAGSVVPTTYDVYFGTDNPPTTKVGSDLTLPSCDPTPGPNEVLVEGATYYWKVVAKRDCGKETEGPVWHFKTGLDPNHIACRSLPFGYWPGVEATVTIHVVPPSWVATYAVQESPPAGWWLIQIEPNDGVHDTVHGTIKWGPYFDNLPRDFRYVLVPPGGTSGVQVFNGVVSLDGVSYAIGCDGEIPMAWPHPADMNDDWQMIVDEVTAYGSAWKRHTAWPRLPEPNDPNMMNYVTRAGFLWRSGESYYLNPNFDPPMCWHSTYGLTDAASTNGEGAIQAIVAIRDITKSEVNGVMVFTVSVAVQPESTVQVYAVEDAPPPGCTVTEVGGGGNWVSAAGVVRWGPFFDSQARTLTYQATMASGAGGSEEFAGRVSVDGQARAIDGETRPLRCGNLEGTFVPVLAGTLLTMVWVRRRRRS